MADFDETTRRQQIAYFFCFSLGITFLCSDVFMVMHKGLYYNWKRLRHETTDEVRHVGIVLLLARVGLLAFIATLWLYVIDPHHLAAIGMCCIIAQVGLRIIGDVAFPHQENNNDDGDHAHSSGKVNVDSNGGDNEDKLSNREQCYQLAEKSSTGIENQVVEKTNE